MLSLSDIRRRQFGLVFLGIALIQLLLGFTLLRASLDGLWFLIYWLFCMGFTVAALVVAVMDMFIVRGRIRRERRELAQTTVKSILPHLPRQAGIQGGDGTSLDADDPRRDNRN